MARRLNLNRGIDYQLPTGLVDKFWSIHQSASINAIAVLLDDISFVNPIASVAGSKATYDLRLTAHGVTEMNDSAQVSQAAILYNGTSLEPLS
jgi:hypothetical protein